MLTEDQSRQLDEGTAVLWIVGPPEIPRDPRYSWHTESVGIMTDTVISIIDQRVNQCRGEGLRSWSWSRRRPNLIVWLTVDPEPKHAPQVALIAKMGRAVGVTLVTES